MSEKCLPAEEKGEFVSSVPSTADIYPTFGHISSVFDSVDICDVEDLPVDLYLECEDDGQYFVETSQATPLHSLIGQNVKLKISFPQSQSCGPGNVGHRKDFVCSSCENKFKTELSLKKHMKRDHNILKPYGCSFCKYKAVNKKLLTRHLKQKHNATELSVSENACENDFQKNVTEGIEAKVVNKLSQSRTDVAGDSSGEPVSRNTATVFSANYGSKSDENDEILNSSSQNIYLCSHCADMFPDETTLNNHCMAIHTCKTLDSSMLQNTLVNRSGHVLKSDDVCSFVSPSTNEDSGNMYCDKKHIENTSVYDVPITNKQSIERMNDQPQGNKILHPGSVLSEDTDRHKEIGTSSEVSTPSNLLNISMNSKLGMHPALSLKGHGSTTNGNRNQTSPIMSNTSEVMDSHENSSNKQPNVQNKNSTDTSKPFICTECPYVCKQKRTFKLHLKKHENSPSQERCLHCSKLFASQAALKRHIKSHSEDRPHHCSITNCDAKFKLKGALTDHLRYVHNKASKSAVQQDVTDDKVPNVKGKHKNFVCSWEKCDKSFRDNYNLTLHYKCHTGERSFHCKDCDYSCIQKTSFDRHLKKHTKNSVGPF